MFLHTQTIPAVVQEFLATHILPRAPTSIAQFGIGFVTPYLANGVNNTVAKNMPLLTMLTIVDENGRVDLEKAKESALVALEKAGGKVNVSGYQADMDDLNVLFEIAQKHATT